MPDRKPLVWVGATLADLRSFPLPVQRTFGYALHVAQLGGRHPDATALHGFGSAGVLEVSASVGGSTFRLVYTVRLHGSVYALHAFQKKSTRGISTARKELALIRSRLAAAQRAHEEGPDAWNHETRR